MAFSTSNVQKNYFGGLKVTVGDWTGSAADSPGTITVEGGRVYSARFSDQDASTPFLIDVPVSVSQSGATSTVTVYNQQAVTVGRFLIISS